MEAGRHTKRRSQLLRALEEIPNEPTRPQGRDRWTVKPATVSGIESITGRLAHPPPHRGVLHPRSFEPALCKKRKSLHELRRFSGGAETSADLKRKRSSRAAGARGGGFDTAQDPDSENKAEPSLAINSA